MKPKEVKWTEAETKIMQESYMTKGPKQLAKELQRTNASVVLKARRMGLKTKTVHSFYVWTPEMLKAIKKLYPTADKQTLEDAIGLPYYAIQTKARRLGLYNTTWKERGSKTKSANNTSCDIHFFDEWSTDMAYVLGLLWADGSIPKRQCEVVIALVETDQCALDFVKEKTKCTREYYHLKANRANKKCQPALWLTIASKIVVRRLMKLGLKPRKSYRDDPFPNVPVQFLPQFIRGFLDGDGCVCITGQGICKVSFVGSPKFIEGIRDSLVKHAGMQEKKLYLEKQKHTMCGRVSWSALNDLRAFSSYIYPPGHGFCLERKRRKLHQWLESKTHTVSKT